MATDLLVPIQLIVSTTPLFLKVDLSNNFPIQPPKLVIMAKVLHSLITPKTKVVITKLLQSWDCMNGSSLLSVVRDMHACFEREPPIPEAL